jgi:hypothetical protein
MGHKELRKGRKIGGVKERAGMKGGKMKERKWE